MKDYLENEIKNELFILANVMGEDIENIYLINSEKSENTCQKCKEMDGEVFLKKDAIIGENYPPFHPNCKCTVTSLYNGIDETNLSNYLKGIVPSTLYINPLQSNVSNIGIRPVSSRDQGIVDSLFNIKTNQYLFRVDKHSINTKSGSKAMTHINVKTPENANILQANLSKYLDHKPISQNAYKAFKNYDDVTKNIKAGGKSLFALSLAIDGIRLYNVAYEDYTGDGKIGSDTAKESVIIAGGWAGGAAGAKLGATGGAALGTIIVPGPGTAIGGFVFGIIGGIAGGFAGENLSDYFVDEIFD